MKTLTTVLFEILMTLAAFAAPTVTDVVAKQRYPWNGLVDITCKVSGIDETITDRQFVLSAVFPDSKNVTKMSKFWVMRDGVKSSDLSADANGDYRLLWDAKADLGEVRYTNMVVRVTIVGDHEKVQLWEGGPYWATKNIGAEKPEDYGYYFWWGDTVGYKRENEKWVAGDGSNSNFSFTGRNTPTYNTSMSTLLREGWITTVGVLAPEHDAAQVHWGGNWRMPRSGEFDDLISKCDWTWTTMNGVKGYIVRGRGDYVSNSIFLPCAGYGGGTSFYSAGSDGCYWSTHYAADGWDADILCFDSSDHATCEFSRDYGVSVRPLQGFTIDGETVISKDSKSFVLDTTDSLITSPITYNSSWIGNNSEAIVVIADNGVEVKRVTGEGEFTYSPTTPGKHTLTYTTYIDDVAQSEVYSAMIFADWKYTVNDGKATIVETTHTSGDVIIPSEIDGHSVVGIRDGLFAGCNGIVDVTMPGGLAESMAEIFPSSYASITNVVLTGGVAQIPAAAFSGCEAIESITLAESGATLSLGDDKGWRFDEDGILRSGKITHNESSSMSMTVHGEGRLTYRWKASCEYYNRFILDYAYLSVDGDAKGKLNNYTLSGIAIGGNTDWQEVSVDVSGEGAHDIAWTFAKDDQDDASVTGEDCAWVDAITYEPFIKLTFDVGEGDGTVPALIKDVQGASVSLPTGEGFAKAKHTFVGWSDGVQTYAPGGAYEIGTANTVLTAVYSPNTLAAPVISSVDVASGGEITTAAARIEITAEGDTAIYYTLDGSTPTSGSLLYGGAFDADGLGQVTVKAIAVRDNYFDSDIAEFTFTRRPYSAAECLNAGTMTFTMSGDAEWSRVLDEASHDGDAALKSGAISHGNLCTVETKVAGPGMISFWWKVSSEIFRDWPLDIVSFTVDGVEQAWLGGVKDWTNIVVDITAPGEHILCWTYKKDEQGEAGEDCAWLDEVVWTPAPDPIPELPITATAAEIAAALDGSADAKLVANITDAAEYAAYRAWALGLEGVTPQQVKDSPNVWLSYTLDTDALIAAAPKEGDLMIDTFESAASDGAFEFAVKINGIAVGDNALEANLRKVFDIEGAEKLASDGAGFSPDNVEVNAAAPENGNVKFTVTPKGGALGSTRPVSFFFRVKMK